MLIFYIFLPSLPFCNSNNGFFSKISGLIFDYLAINGKAIGKGGIMLTEIFHNALTSINKFYFSFWYSISTTFDIKINLKMKFKIFTSLNVY